MPASEIPVYGGMLDLSPHATGSRCHRCGWEGVPTFWRGRALDVCPACEMQDADAEWLELFEAIWRLPRYRRLTAYPGNLAAFTIRQRRRVRTYIDEHGVRRREGEKHSRNAPCVCGSGLKYKRCCGR